MFSYKTKKDTNTSAHVVMKVLSNRNRYAIMELLLRAKEDLCVHEISEMIGISQSATSHQLAFLEARGVVRCIHMGRTRCYVPTDTPLAQKIARVISTLS